MTEIEFNQLRNLFKTYSGIEFDDKKIHLLEGRLNKRLKYTECTNFNEYFKHISDPLHRSEFEIAMNLLTTNETYFFREKIHFDYLAQHYLPTIPSQHPLKVWSAASSTGEEAYSIAMTLSEHRPLGSWHITGTDINDQVIQIAKKGLYSITNRIDLIPTDFLKKYCLKGKGQYIGFFKMRTHILNQVNFFKLNLMNVADFQKVEPFDVIFLRNVLIYFKTEAKAQILRNLIKCLKPNGILIIGRAESLIGLNLPLIQVQPSIFRKK